VRRLKRELWPYCIEYSKAETDCAFIKVEEWLGENIGCFHQQWNAVYHQNRTDIYFKRSEDVTLFSLRWS
jgi:hypothetical protein